MDEEVSSKIALCFDLANSPSLSLEDKELVASRLGRRIDKTEASADKKEDASEQGCQTAQAGGEEAARSLEKQEVGKSPG